MVAYAFVTAEEEDTHEPWTYREAVACEDISKWKAAMKEEMNSLRKNKTWELVNHPARKKLRAGIDCNEVFSLVVRHTSIRIILALTVCKDYELEQLDVKTAFLHGNVKEVIYMRQPPGYEQDDMLIACKSKAEIGSTKSLLKKEFDVKEHWGSKEASHHGNHVDVTGFVDLDYAKDPDKGRFITGYAFLVQGCVVSWKATLQHVVALSTTETEYMTLTEAMKEAIWLRGLLEELGVELNTVAVNYDNQGVLEAKTVKVLKVGTEHNVADALTNVIPGLKLQHCLELLNVDINAGKLVEEVFETLKVVFAPVDDKSFGCPIKRDELTQLVTKNYQNQSFPSFVLNKAFNKLYTIFGYDVKELQHVRPSSTNQARASQSSGDAKSYIITSQLDPQKYKKHIEDETKSHLTGFTFVAIGIVHLAGGKITEETLWHHLGRLGMSQDDERHTDFGSTKQAVETLVQQRYFQKYKSNGPEGLTLYYELAERGLNATNSSSFKDCISEAVMRPSSD
ncbi:melanoma-associated antigen 8 isoform X1 [Tanacetum coccineum]